MRTKTVKMGLRFITGGIFAVIVATFFHGWLSEMFLLSQGAEGQLILLGLLLGGILGFAGILFSVTGFLRAPCGVQEPISTALILLLVVILLFFYLMFFPVEVNDLPRLRPGERIVI